RMGPAARRMQQEGKPSASAATGTAERVSRADAFAAAAEERSQTRAQTAAAAPAAATAPTEPVQRSTAPPPGAPGPTPTQGRAEQRARMTRLRARIAERLLEAQATQALLTTFNEVDLTAVQALRNRHKDDFEKQHGAKLGLMSFFVKACIAALRRFPVVNASVDGSDIVYHDYFDIGVAVST